MWPYFKDFGIFQLRHLSKLRNIVPIFWIAQPPKPLWKAILLRWLPNTLDRLEYPKFSKLLGIGPTMLLVAGNYSHVGSESASSGAVPLCPPHTVKRASDQHECVCVLFSLLNTNKITTKPSPRIRDRPIYPTHASLVLRCPIVGHDAMHVATPTSADYVTLIRADGLEAQVHSPIKSNPVRRSQEAHYIGQQMYIREAVIIVNVKPRPRIHS